MDWYRIDAPNSPRQTLDGKDYLFFQKGRKSAGNANARDDCMRVDFFSKRWPRSLHQLPEAPYTHWMPLPTPPEDIP